MAEPFGVELPADIGSAPNSAPEMGGDSAPESGTEFSGTNKSDTTKAPQELMDIDKLEKFRFNGREWSAKDLKDAYLMREDYTRKTQELSETRKYQDNFATDLSTLRENPKLFSEFARIYPSEYVKLARKLLGSNQTPQTPGATNQTPQHDERLDRLTEIEDKLGNWEKAQHQAEVQKIQSWLDNQYTALSQKFPHANHEAVTARAEVLDRNGTEITQNVLEKLFKQNDAEVKAVMDKMYKAKVTKQLEANAKTKDMGPGGGVPSQAPKSPKTFKEARRQWESDLEQGKG